MIQRLIDGVLNFVEFFVTELPVASPLIHGILRSLSLWQDLIKDDLANRGPAPNDFIPGKALGTVNVV